MRYGESLLCTRPLVGWPVWRATIEERQRICVNALRSACSDGNARLASGALYEMATIATRQDQMERAARLFGVTAKLVKISGREIEAYGADEYKSSVGAVRAQPDEATFKAAWEAGQQMTMEQAVAFALEEADV